MRPVSCGRSKKPSEIPIWVNPTNDGNIIRVSIPQLTEERRRDLVKQAKAKAKTRRSRCATYAAGRWRNYTGSRRTARPARDEVGRAEKELNKSTHQYVGQIDELVKHKESELLEV